METGSSAEGSSSSGITMVNPWWFIMVNPWWFIMVYRTMAIIQQNMVRIRRMAGNRDQLKGCHGSHGPTKLWSSSLIPLPATRWTMWSDRLPSWPEQVPFEQPLDVRAGKHLIGYMTYYIYIYIRLVGLFEVQFVKIGGLQQATTSNHGTAGTPTWSLQDPYLSDPNSCHLQLSH